MKSDGVKILKSERILNEFKYQLSKPTIYHKVTIIKYQVLDIQNTTTHSSEYEERIVQKLGCCPIRKEIKKKSK